MENEALAAPDAAEECDSERLLTIQELYVREGEEAEFFRRFNKLDVLQLAADAADGTLEQAVLVQSDQRFVVVTLWLSGAGIEGWVASPARERVRAELEPLYAQPPAVTRYAVRSQFEGKLPEAGPR